MSRTIKSFLLEKDGEIETLLDKWGMTRDSEIRHETKAHIIKWLKNTSFQSRTANNPNIFIYEDAFLILKQIEYLHIDEASRFSILNNACKSYLSDSKISINDSSIRIYPLGNSTSEGGINYIKSLMGSLKLTKKTTPLDSLENIDINGVHCVIFCDDFIGSGKTLNRFIEDKIKNFLPLSIKVIILCQVGFHNVIEDIEKKHPHIRVFSAKKLQNEDKAFDVSSKFFELSDRPRIEQWCKEIGTKLYPKHPLGYSNCQSLIVFDDGYVPNNTLPIIWAGPDSEADGELKYTWQPLFARVKVNESSDESNIIGKIIYKEIIEYKLLSIDSYKTHLSKFEDEGLFLIQHLAPAIIEKVNQVLLKNGVIFITAPILYGKSIILSLFKKQKVKDVLFSEIDGSILKTHEISSITSLLYYWLDNIVQFLLASKNETKINYPDLYINLKSIDAFTKWFESGSELNGKLFKFISKLNDINTSINTGKHLIVSVHIDSIQKHVSKNLFNELKDLISDYDFGYSNSKVRLIFTSRYFPINYKRPILFFMPSFEVYHISTILKTIYPELSDSTLSEMAKIIYEETEGHPWFIYRFFMVYLYLRSESYKQSFSSLSQTIFEESKYWTCDDFKNPENDSKYLKYLQLIIKDSEDIQEKSEFFTFINKPNIGIKLMDGNKEIVNNFIVQQSGFLNFDHEKDRIKSNGNNILKSHFINRISKS